MTTQKKQALYRREEINQKNRLRFGNSKNTKMLQKFWTYISTHPLWSSIIAGIVLLILGLLVNANKANTYQNDNSTHNTGKNVNGAPNYGNQHIGDTYIGDTTEKK